MNEKRPGFMEMGVATDRAFEQLAEELDRIAQKHHLTSDQMKEMLQHWGNFKDYYVDWMNEAWEPVHNSTEVA